MTIEGFRKQAGGRGFADAAGAGEQVSVVQAVVFDGVAERTSDMLLPRDLIKSLRSPFSRDYLVRHRESKIVNSKS